MSDINPTYASEDGITYAVIDGKVVASGPDFDEVQRIATDICDDFSDKDHTSATHVVTPNGIKGKILSRTASVWGDEVTVRFDNGQIHSLSVTDRTNFVTENLKTASTRPIDKLRTEFSKIATGHNRKNLTDRLATINEAKNEAHTLISNGVSDSDARELHELILTADHEVSELKQGIDHIDATEGEGFTPYKPEMQVIPGAEIGHNNDGTWLDNTLNEMLEETNRTDFNTMMDDDPTLLASEMDNEMVADSEAVRDKALSYVRSKVAGLEGTEVEEFEKLFIARCEDARRVELAHRKATTKKEAAQKKTDVDDSPVESLFM